MSGQFTMDSGWSRIKNSASKWLMYPSPFFDVAGTYFPKSVKELFEWCRIYYYINPIIHAGLNKVAVYPLTDIEYEDEDPELIRKWKDILENIIDYRKFQVGISVEHQVYGNSLVSIGFPFVKKLVCKKCGYAENVKLADYRFKSGYFHLKRCKKCGWSGRADVRDEDVKSVTGLKLIRWNVEDVTTEYNPISGVTEYYYKVPDPIANDIKIGKRVMVETTRQVFIDSVRERKMVLLNKDNLFHLKRTSLSSELGGWGTPRILPVLRDAFGMQILRKSQEMVSIEHSVPLRIIHPAPMADATVSPYSSLNLAKWKEDVNAELRRWRMDQNYIPITTLPLGYQEFGGNAKVLMLAPEIRANAELLLAGMEIPTEFLFGGVQWSGSNVSLRMMENSMLGDIRSHKSLLRWVMKKISSYFGIPFINAKFKPFKMADDLQRMAFNLQLAQSGKLSDYTLLSSADYNPDEEYKRIQADSTRRQEMAKDAAIAQAKSQVLAQQAIMEMQTRQQSEMARRQGQLQTQMMMAQGQAQQKMQAGQPVNIPPSQHTLEQNAIMAQAASPVTEVEKSIEQQRVQLPPPTEQIVTTLRSVEPSVARELLKRLKEQNPEIFRSVLQSLKEQRRVKVDSRPLPQQLPPRRETPSI